jgi:hypothetical protein
VDHETAGAETDQQAEAFKELTQHGLNDPHPEERQHSKPQGLAEPAAEAAEMQQQQVQEMVSNVAK